MEGSSRAGLSKGNSESGDAVAQNRLHEKRIIRRRVKTGCITCRIRKVRCDERKPTCHRCSSTGRKCDGYLSVTQPSTDSPDRPAVVEQAQKYHSAISKQPGIPLPKKSDQELRSFRFFLEITVPEIANVFDIDFWLTEIPRTCHIDPAIWHATVSLGAVHERTIAMDRGNAYTGAGLEFALQQFNTAIGHIVRPSDRPPLKDEKWRAVVVSILFTYQCSLQGLYAQSNVHLTAAKRLMNELQQARNRTVIPRRRQRLLSKLKSPESNDQSISYDSLLDVVANLETHDTSGAATLFGDLDAYTSWRYYSAPKIQDSQKLCHHGRCVPSRATPKNLNQAGKAIKSLMYALMTTSQRDAGDLVDLVLEGHRDRLKTLTDNQKPHTRALCELDAAIQAFVSDTTVECSCFDAAKGDAMPLRLLKRATAALRLYYVTCYPILLDKSPMAGSNPQFHHPLLIDMPSPANRNNATRDQRASDSRNMEALTKHFTKALDLAESLLSGETPQSSNASASDFAPTLPTTMPLFLIASMAGLSGVETGLRYRVIEGLKRFPKREVLWDSSFAAALIELTMSLERQNTVHEAVAATSLPQKVHGITAEFIEEKHHTAQVVVQTWEDWIENRRGEARLLRW
ncbi:hypothetical protein DM02DRAFT_344028 [Periconia macrospinosa]|uniref:Zn(2)-C6 fungal-type domain-containing protein n=1 Tax=Periconia macrospinosa TaxID=97972 RepID=A0A2V1D035_9PLEO|nr:hypothetical protein DM02DRAFT_344028 [Periconia macrospinosa]